MSTRMNLKDIRVECVVDKPTSGMWHNGPNPSWVTVTHIPTMITARAYDRSQHRARQSAMACVEMMVEASQCDECSFPKLVEYKNEET